MENKNLFLIILVGLFVLTSIISVKAETVSTECTQLLSVLQSSYGGECGDEKYDKRTDFNNDKKIDFEDQMLLSTNYDSELWCKEQMEKTFNPCIIIVYTSEKCPGDCYCDTFGDCNKGYIRTSTKCKIWFFSRIGTCCCKEGPKCKELNLTLTRAYGSECGDNNYNPIADFCGKLGDPVKDGKVNFDDLMIFATNYGNEEWCNLQLESTTNPCGPIIGPKCTELNLTFTRAYGGECGDAKYNKIADIDNNKEINFEDLIVFGMNAEDEVWCKEQLEKTFNPCDIPSNIGVYATRLLSILTESYRTECGDTKYNKIADFDNSKKIDFDDLGIFAMNAEDEVWCKEQLEKTFNPCMPSSYYPYSKNEIIQTYWNEYTYSYIDKFFGDTGAAFYENSPDNRAVVTVRELSGYTDITQLSDNVLEIKSTRFKERLNISEPYNLYFSIGGAGNVNIDVKTGGYVKTGGIQKLNIFLPDNVGIKLEQSPRGWIVNNGVRDYLNNIIKSKNVQQPDDLLYVDPGAGNFEVTFGNKTCIEEGKVGWLSNYDFCCEGLKKIGNSNPPGCLVPTDTSFVCTNCGNGNCGLGENYCNCPEDCKEETKCNDSDGGKNYYVFGETYGEYGSNTDVCRGDKIEEYYCENNIVKMELEYVCPYGCSNGACSCDIMDTLAEGESKNYTIGSFGYNVEAIIISNIYPYQVKFKVNGETTDSLSEGNRFKLADGAELAVIEILPNEAGDVTQDLVTFCLNGKTVDNDIICTDSDGGKNYYVKGKGTGAYSNSKEIGVIWGENSNKCSARWDTNLGTSIHYDCCSDAENSNQLNEAYCDINGILQSTGYNCPNGCKDGACIEEGTEKMRIDGTYMFLDELYPDDVYSSPVSFYTGVLPSETMVTKVWSLLDFDLDGLENKEITRAELVIQNIAFEQEDYGKQVVGVYKVIEPWKTTTASWNNKPNYDRTIVSSHEVTNPGRYAFDITQIMSYLIKYKRGVLLKAEDETEPNLKKFDEAYLNVWCTIEEEEPKTCKEMGGKCRYFGRCKKDEIEEDYKCPFWSKCCMSN